LNNYHQKVREVIGAEAEIQGKLELINWLDSATAPISTGFSPPLTSSTAVYTLCAFITSVFLNKYLS